MDTLYIFLKVIRAIHLFVSS